MPMELLMLVEGTTGPPREGSDELSRQGEWIANCKPDRVDRIRAASVFLLQVGPPQPNQLQTLQDLEDRGLVGLYRVGEKSPPDIRQGQETYLKESDFMPTPAILMGFWGPRGPGGTR